MHIARLLLKDLLARYTCMYVNSEHKRCSGRSRECCWDCIVPS